MVSKTRRCLILIWFILGFGSIIATAGEINDNPPIASMGGVKALCQWWPNDKYLIASMHLENNYEDNVLDIYDVSREPANNIGKFILGGFPYCVTQFGDKLIVVCQTATAYLVYAFAYTNDSIKMIFKDGSKYPPELNYFGPTYKAAVTVRILDWVEGKRIPVSANVYLLEGESEVKPLNLPWNKRFGLEK